MKIYKAKTGGGSNRAIRITQAVVSNAETLSLLPQGFKLNSRVNQHTHAFTYKGERGMIGDWLVLPEPSDYGLKFVNVRDNVTFVSQFYVEPPKSPAYEAPQNNALEFEMAIHKTIAEQMAKGLTVTEAVGTLQLCSMDIADQFFNNTTPQP